ncbi:MAG: nucleotidyltransferase domain-containing protein [Fibrobacterota bacterium]
MKKKPSIARKLHELLPILKAEFGVKKLAFFGSFASGKASPHSDLDLVVYLDKPIGFKFLDLKKRLEKETGRDVDLLTRDGLIGIRSSTAAASIKRNLSYV